MKTITIEATRRIEPGGSHYMSTVPDGYALISVQTAQTESNGFVRSVVFHTYAPLVADEAPASSPTDAEIARRVDLLIKSCNETIVRDPSITDFGAIQWGKFYIVMTRKDCRVWTDATEDVYMCELRRVAIRQLLAERGGK